MHMPTRRTLRRLALPVAAVGVLATLPAVTAASAAGDDAPLSLRSAVPVQTLERYKGEPVALYDLGLHAVAGATPFEVRAKHVPYRSPVTADLMTAAGPQRLPEGLTTDVNTLSDFFTVSVYDKAGKRVMVRWLDFCPNSYETGRARPDAPARSPYPQQCGSHPFAIASVLGVQAGWSVPALNSYEDTPSFTGRDGAYTVKLSVRTPYRKALGIPADVSTVSTKINVKTVEEPEANRVAATDAAHGHGQQSAHGAHSDAVHEAALAGRVLSPQQQKLHAARVRANGTAPRPAAAPPSPRARVAAPPAGPRPDLRSLPALDIALDRLDENGRPSKRTYMQFGATVWNSGDSPLVVDGFRRPGTGLMDAHQYFFDGAGEQVGSTPAGTLEWDPREGHTHWHFTAFAAYRLLDADKKIAVRSGKEAFCLVPTDPVNLWRKNASFKPESTDLTTACGSESSMSIRETLDIGWGDTYTQGLPGQSFDVTTLKNGTYYIEVLANPDGKLVEASTTNNRSLRKVVLGGTVGGQRTIKVPPYQGIAN